MTNEVLQILELEFQTIGNEIERMENIQFEIEKRYPPFYNCSNWTEKDDRKYSEIQDKIYELECKQGEVQDKIDSIMDKIGISY